MNQEFTRQTKELIDNLKGVCTSYGLGNDGNEFKIITQVFLYKFMNDKFGYELKQLEPSLKDAESWEQVVADYSDDKYDLLLLKMSPDSARLKREHYLSNLHNRQNQEEFAKYFDDTLRDIAIFNKDIFSVKTEGRAKVELFDELSQFISDSSKRDDFCRALVNQLVNFSFEKTFNEKFDFFSTIFEYLIKDYNKDGGGKYAEYYTPHAVSKIMASILVDEPTSNVTIYDPSAGSGTLLMNLAHAIGEDRCTIYSQDVSQKSTAMLRLNLVLNNLVHSIQNIIQGNTILHPYHRNGDKLKKFDYIVSNPPFKLDFSDYRDDLDTSDNHDRFFAGVPNIPNKKKESMAIYLLFIQHIVYSLNEKGKAAVVVPTGFLTAKSGIEKKIKEELIRTKSLLGVVTMPSNIFATTATNVSVLFFDKGLERDYAVLCNASELGTIIKDGKNQKTILSEEENQKIIETMSNALEEKQFSKRVKFKDISERKYSINPGHYFDVEIDFKPITPEEFIDKKNSYILGLKELVAKGEELDSALTDMLEKLEHER